MTFQTVFDAAQNGYAAWWVPAFGLLMVLAAVGFTGWPFSRWVQRNRAIDRFGVGLAVFCTISIFASTFSDYRAAVSKLREGKFDVVEGVVTDFAELPKGSRQKTETFVVGGRRFTYRGDDTTAGFNQMVSQGGPIHEGLYVRIAYSGPDILRLEIAQ
jgi:hypothetical protein